jgi:hypothetical protein
MKDLIAELHRKLKEITRSIESQKESGDSRIVKGRLHMINNESEEL